MFCPNFTLQNIFATNLIHCSSLVVQMLQLTMKCWNLAFNARGSRLFIVVVKLGSVKIYVAAVEALRRKKKQDESQFTTKIDSFLSFIPRWMLMYFFLQVFKKNLTLCMTKLRVLVLCFSYFTDNSNTYPSFPSWTLQSQIPNQSAHWLSQVWKAKKANETKSG